MKQNNIPYLQIPRKRSSFTLTIEGQSPIHSLKIIPILKFNPYLASSACITILLSCLCRIWRAHRRKLTERLQGILGTMAANTRMEHMIPARQAQCRATFKPIPFDVCDTCLQNPGAGFAALEESPAKKADPLCRESGILPAARASIDQRITDKTTYHVHQPLHEFS